ncbi:MAG: Re/Si-specific NAD(P)(+) transhydrogenase subunit alpha [Alphaproteobacteria bacterium]
MKIAVLKEQGKGETRLAVSPETIKKFTAMGCEVVVQNGAGTAIGVTDDALEAAGAKLLKTPASVIKDAELLLCVKPPKEADKLPKGAILCGILDPHDRGAEGLQPWADQGISSFAMEFMPRITRAQSMDVLSSQSNLAGYRAVIEGAYAYARAFPMLMTAAGTVAPARALVIGAGVAGLQAIATAKRLGAVVSAFDVRAAAKEQVESLGASFIEVEGGEDLETKGGYAKEASDEYKQKQAELITATLKKADIVITTALIPGRPAPLLITHEQIAGMKPGAVIVDMAAERGGNVAATERGKHVTTDNGVHVIGFDDLPARVGADTAQLYAKNLFNFLSPMIDDETGVLTLNWADETVRGTALTHDGAIVHESFGGTPVPDPSATEDTDDKAEADA